MEKNEILKTISTLINETISHVPRAWRGPIILLTILLIGGLTFFYMTHMPLKNNGDSTIQISHGDNSENINNKNGNVTINK